MTDKLFVVSTQRVVLAKDEEEAAERSRTRLFSADLDVFQIRRPDDIPMGLEGTVPIAGEEGVTVEEYLDRSHLDLCDNALCSPCSRLARCAG